ncbi:MAG TPA: thioredoxin family protein [Gemmatimonadales bacterium]|nr:thioredoxin family protein [Gemmatimonadales bacterium]
MIPDPLRDHPVVPHDQWVAAREALLAQEKAFTRAKDDLTRQRRSLPWERVEKAYVFDAPSGRETLADLFDGRSQLVVYHFMFGPEMRMGCKHCSFWADHYDGPGLHLPYRDVSFVAISRTPLAQIEAFKQRMGWRFKWVSSGDTDFNYDLGVSFTSDELEQGTMVYNYEPTDAGGRDREGLSVFYQSPDGTVFHTYSCYARGIESLNGTYHFLDLVPKGRDENPDDPQSWVRHHDRYAPQG